VSLSTCRVSHTASLSKPPPPPPPAPSTHLVPLVPLHHPVHQGAARPPRGVEQGEGAGGRHRELVDGAGAPQHVGGGGVAIWVQLVLVAVVQHVGVLTRLGGGGGRVVGGYRMKR